jgi:hypothetical protein
MLASRKMKGVSGIFVALILFGMLFAVAGNYYLFVSRSDLSTNQANAARQDALALSRQENLLTSASLTGVSTLVLSAINTGGVPTTISSIYVSDIYGNKISSLMGPTGTNFTAAQWPLTLDVGATRNAQLTGYTYASGTVFVKAVTQRGNVFSAQYPPPFNGGVGGNTLVVTIVAAPTPPLTQVFTCSACITVNITAYNFAPNPLVGATLVPAVPTSTTTGTAIVSGGSCGAPSPSSTIPFYSGSGSAPSVKFTCKFNSQTGLVGGYASFSGFVQGTLNGVLTSSALAVSNNIQIGGGANVLTQGAFSINFFFFRSSSCFQAAGNWHTPCVTVPAVWPPTSVNNLPAAATISGGTNHYVAFYVQIRNNYIAPLEILQYTFLQLDASHPPPVVGNESDFWLSGAVSTYNSTGHYYPNYSTNPPSLTAYAGNEKTCAETGPKWNLSPNCIDVSTGQSVTLTFAACGFGATDWDWGGSQYASHFDNGVGCTSSTPSFSNLGAANILTLVICFEYQGQIYTQAIQFQGLSVIP